MPLDVPVTNRDALNEAVFEYDRASAVYGRADKEFADHINRFKTNEQNYQSHRAEIEAQEALLAGDRDYLKTILASPDQRPAMIAKTISEYTRAIDLECVVVLKYRVFEQVAQQVYPKGVTRENVTDELPQISDLTARAVTAMEQLVGKANFLEDSADTLEYITRANTRIKTLQAAAPTTAK